VDETGTQPSGERLPDPRLADPRVAENVDALVDTVRVLLAAEESRDQSFNGRGVGLAGFVGIIVSLTATIGRDAIQAGLERPWTTVSLGLFGGALVLMLATVAVVVRGVLIPKESAHLAYTDVVDYPLPAYVYQSKIMTQGRTLRGLVDILGIERERSSRKARLLHVAYGTLLAGLICIAGLGFIVALGDAGVISHERGRATELKLCLSGGTTSTGGTSSPPSTGELALRASCP
jgi:hypothetical protein